MNTRNFKAHGLTRWLFALALALCALGTQARAQNNDNTGAQAAPPVSAQTAQQQQQAGEPVIRLMDALNLTPEQHTQLAAIAQQHNVDLQAAHQRLQLARRALNQAIYTDNPDQNIVNERTRDVVAAQEALIRLNAQTELKVRQVLTPEQLRMFRIIRRQQRLQTQQDGNPRRLPRERFPGAGRQPNAPPNVGNNSNAPLTPRERRQRQKPRP